MAVRFSLVAHGAKQDLLQLLLDGAVCGVLHTRALGIGWPCRAHDVHWLVLGPLHAARRALRAQQPMIAGDIHVCASGTCPCEEPGAEP